MRVNESDMVIIINSMVDQLNERMSIDPTETFDLQVFGSMLSRALMLACGNKYCMDYDAAECTALESQFSAGLNDGLVEYAGKYGSAIYENGRLLHYLGGPNQTIFRGLIS